MAFRVDLDKGLLVQALEAQYASLKRQKNTSKNPAFGPIIDIDMTKVDTAIRTITEVK